MRCLLFDLDGVLVDTRPLMAAALRNTAQALGMPPPDTEALAAAITLAPTRAARHLFPTAPSAVSLVSCALTRQFDQARACDGIREALSLATAADLPLGVVTSRNRQEAARCLHAAQIDGFFRVVITWGDTARHKPFPDPLLAALTRLGCVRGHYVGDTPDDMRAAVAAGLQPLGAGWASAWGDAALHAAGATQLLRHPLDLLRQLSHVEVCDDT